MFCVCVCVYLWGIPMITLSTPLLLDTSMIVLRAGMRDSQPSRPNLFSEDHFFWRNSSNLWRRGGAAASHWGLTGINLTCVVCWGRCAEVKATHTHLVDRIIRPKRVLFSSRLNVMIAGVSNFCLIHWHCCTSLMNINSTPMCWQ